MHFLPQSGKSGTILLLLLTAAVVNLSHAYSIETTFSAPQQRTPASAEIPNLHNISFKHLNVDDGLSQVSVNSITQDASGFIWFATQDGIDRYDGKGFLNYRHSEDDPASIPGNWVTFVHTSRDGVLWVGSNGNGVARKPALSNKFSNVAFFNDDKPVKNIRAKNLFEDSHGNLWLASWGNGLFRYIESTGRFKSVWAPENEDSRIWTIVEWNSQLLVGTDAGRIWVFDPNKNHAQLWGFQPQGVNKVQHLLSDNDSLWVATDNGLWKYSQQLQFSKVLIHTYSETDKQPNIYRLFNDRKDNLWLGTLGEGLFIKRSDGSWLHQKSTQTVLGLSNDRILSFFQDHADVIWVGTESGGVNYYDPYSIQFHHVGQQTGSAVSLNDNMIFSISQTSDGDWWIGTESGGLNRWNAKSARMEYYTRETGHLLNNSVRAILPWNDGVWVGTFGGIAFINSGGQKGATFNHENLSGLGHDAVFTLERANDQQFWIGSYGGLDLFDTKKNRIVKSLRKSDSETPLPRNIVTALHQNQETLWIGTWGGGLARLQIETGIMRYFQYNKDDKNSLSNDSIWRIFTSSDSRMWIGTDGGGLNLYRPRDGSFQRIQQSEGLANPVVYGIEEDSNGKLWLSTNRGLSRLDTSSMTIRNYYQDDGLQGREFNAGAYFSNSELIAFGGINGLSIFNARTQDQNPFPPQTQIVDFRLYNRSYKQLANREFQLEQTQDKTLVRLGYRQKMLTIDFRALHFSGSSRNQFKYRLVGLNDEWINASDDQFEATYTNLNPGQYLFEVAAISKDGIADQTPARVQMQVEPPPWRSWWAYLTYSLVGITIIYFYRRSYQKKLAFQQAMNAQLMEISSLKERLNNSERMSVLGELASNIAHSLRNPLANIRTTAEIMEIEANERSANQEDAQQIISEVDRLSLWIKELLNYSIESSHFEPLELVGFAAKLLDEFEKTVKLSTKNVALNFESEVEKAFIKADSILLTHLFTSLFANALESLEDKGVITLFIGLKGSDRVAAVISDTGHGMQADLQEKIFETNVSDKKQGLGLGLSLVKRISERHGAVISVFSKVDYGTKFEIVFNIDKGEDA